MPKIHNFYHLIEFSDFELTRLTSFALDWVPMVQRLLLMLQRQPFPVVFYVVILDVVLCVIETKQWDVNEPESNNKIWFNIQNLF